MEATVSIENRTVPRGAMVIAADVVVGHRPRDPRADSSVGADPDPVFVVVERLQRYRSAVAGEYRVIEDEDGCVFVSVAFRDAETEERASSDIALLSLDLLEATGVLVGLASYVIERADHGC